MVAASSSSSSPLPHSATHTCSEVAWACRGFVAPDGTVTRVMVKRCDCEFSGKSSCSDVRPPLENEVTAARRMISKGGSWRQCDASLDDVRDTWPFAAEVGGNGSAPSGRGIVSAQVFNALLRQPDQGVEIVVEAIDERLPRPVAPGSGRVERFLLRNKLRAVGVR